MTWVNLNDVYVEKTGGVVNGNLDVKGTILVDNGSGDGKKYNVAKEISNRIKTHGISDATLDGTDLNCHFQFKIHDDKNNKTYTLAFNDKNIVLWNATDSRNVWTK